MKNKNLRVFNNKLLKIVNETNYQFEYWLNGNFEDDPLPYEIKYILFSFSLKNNVINLSFSGGDMLNKTISPLTYYPLEVQFFNFSKFFNMFRYFFIYKTKKSANNNLRKVFCFRYIFLIIRNYLSNTISNMLKNKIILLGYENESISKCIIIQK